MFPSTHSMIVSLISTMIVLITMLILILILTSMIRMDITGWCFLITLRSTNSLLLKPWPIEIVELPIKNGDFPIKNGGSFRIFPLKMVDLSIVFLCLRRVFSWIFHPNRGESVLPGSSPRIINKWRFPEMGYPNSWWI